MVYPTGNIFNQIDHPIRGLFSIGKFLTLLDRSHFLLDIFSILLDVFENLLDKNPILMAKIENLLDKDDSYWKIYCPIGNSTVLLENI